MGKRKGFHIPGYNYCGPGTSYDGDVPDPINRIDAACQRHDNNPDFDYIRYNKADAQLITEVTNSRSDDPMAADMITSFFKAKKIVAPHKRARLNSDLPSNVIHTNVHEGESTETSGSMYNRKRRTPRRSKMGARPKKYRRNARKVRLPRKSRRSNKKSRNFPRNLRSKIIQALNPSRTYDHSNGVTYQLDSAEKSYWIDPHYEASTTRTAVVDKALGSILRMNALYQALWGNAITQGEKYRVDSAYECFRMTNYSNSPMHIKIYYLKCKQEDDNTPLQWIDDNAVSAAGMFPGDAGTNLASNDGAAGHIASADTTAKNIGLKDFPELLERWKITSVKKVTLEGNANLKVVLKQNKRTHTQSYSQSDFVPGLKRIILRIDTDLTASRTVSSVVRDVVTVKGYSFTGQSLVISQRQITKISHFTNQQVIRYVDNVGLTGAAVDQNVNQFPGWVGVGVNVSNTAGTATVVPAAF